MNASEYQAAASRTFNMELEPQERCNNAILGLIGETGEIADLLKKYYYHGHELNTAKLLEEIGDAEWYVAQMCSVFGWSIAGADEYDLNWERNHILSMAEIVGIISARLAEVECEPSHIGRFGLSHIREDLEDLHGFFLSIANHYGASPSDIWQANIDKLMKRYPNGFNSADSINREV